MIYGIRPEHLEFADDGIEAEVVVVEPTGSETQIVARIGTQDMIAVFRDRRPVKPGDKINLQAARERRRICSTRIPASADQLTRSTTNRFQQQSADTTSRY